jgi:hypothetical protein
MTDENPAHQVLADALRRLHDTDDVLTAVGAACRLLREQLEALESELLELARLAADKRPG